MECQQNIIKYLKITNIFRYRFFNTLYCLISLHVTSKVKKVD